MSLPTSCTLSAAELGVRRSHLLPGLCTQATRRVVLSDGYRLTFTPATGLLESIARVVDAERQCCRFLRFVILVEPDGAAITLDVTGPEGTREFLADLFDGGGTEVRNGGTEVPPSSAFGDGKDESAQSVIRNP